MAESAVVVKAPAEQQEPSPERIEEIAVAGIAGKKVADTAAAKEETETKVEPVVKEDAVKDEKPEGDDKGDDDDVDKDDDTDDTLSIEDIADDSKKHKPISQKAQERIDRKIGKAIKERNIARDELAKLMEENERLKSNAISNRRPVPPTPDQFQTDREYRDAMIKWKDADDKWKEQSVSRDNYKRELDQRIKSDIERFRKNSSRMSDRFSDYDELVNQKTNYGPLAPVILSSEFAPEISYYLAKNPQVHAEIMAMNNERAYMAIGEISGQFKSIQKKTTKAPLPISPVKGSEGGPDDMFSTQEIDKISKNILETA